MDAVVGRDKAPLDVHLDVPWIHPEDEAAGRTWENDQVLYRVRPRIEVGDLLWVRETHMILEGLPGSPWPDLPHRSASGGRIVHYREGFDRSPPYRWRPSIHMPKWAARLWLRVTDVRAQRLHDISEDDILSEGVTVSLVSEWTGVPWSDIPDLHTAWQLGWDHINAARGFGWDTNTWTWAFTFERTEAPA